MSIPEEDDDHAVRVLVFKAANADKSEDAMRFSQAACNAANALHTVVNMKKAQQL